MALVSRRLGKTVLRTLPYLLQTTKRGIISEIDPRIELLLRDVDLPYKDPNFFRSIAKTAFFERFPIKLIEIPEIGLPGNNVEIRRCAVILPLETGCKDYVIPIPFILDTGAPDYLYLCWTAVKELVPLNCIEQITASYQLIGRLLGTGQNFIDHPLVSSLPTYYKVNEPDDPRLNILGIKGMMQLGMRISTVE